MNLFKIFIIILYCLTTSPVYAQANDNIADDTAKKWSGAVQAGLGYDSNIILSSTNNEITGRPLNDGGLRFHILGDFEYEFKNTNDRELLVHASTLYIWSIDEELAPADPWLINLNLPYIIKSHWNERPYELTLAPGYSALYMDYDNLGSRTQTLSSIFGIMKFKVMANEQWSSSATLKINQKDSLLLDTADNNSDALQIHLSKEETIYLNASNKQTLTAGIGYVGNNAEGKNKSYKRYDLNILYSAPLFSCENTTWNAGIATNWLNYSESQPTRASTHTSFLAGVKKIESARWHWELNMRIASSSSSQDSYTYDGHSILGLVGHSF